MINKLKNFLFQKYNFLKNKTFRENRDCENKEKIAKRNDSILANNNNDEWRNFLKEYFTLTTQLINDKEAETRVIFLDGEFGWGKSYFIKEILKVNPKYVYSPWLDIIDKELTESILNNILSRKRVIKTLISIVLTYISVIVAIYYFKSTFPSVAYFLADKLGEVLNTFGISNSRMAFLILLIPVVSFSIISISWYSNISFSTQKVKTNYDLMFNIKKITKHIPECLVIEDIDRMEKEDIEYILKVIKQMSDHLISTKSYKYIVLTGDWDILHYSLQYDKSRKAEINPDLKLSYSKNSLYYSKVFLERMIQYKVDFIKPKQRIYHLFSNYGIHPKYESDNLIFDVLHLIAEEYGMTYRWFKKSMPYLLKGTNYKQQFDFPKFCSNLNDCFIQSKGITVTDTRGVDVYQSNRLYYNQNINVDQPAYNVPSNPLHNFLSSHKKVLTLLEWEIIIAYGIDINNYRPSSYANLFLMHLLGVNEISNMDLYQINKPLKNTDLKEKSITKKNIFGNVGLMFTMSQSINYRNILTHFSPDFNGGSSNNDEKFDISMELINETFDEIKSELNKVFGEVDKLRNDYPEFAKLIESDKKFNITLK